MNSFNGLEMRNINTFIHGVEFVKGEPVNGGSQEKDL